MSEDLDNETDDAQEFEDGASDEGNFNEILLVPAKSNLVLLIDTEDASETDMLKYEGEYTEIKEQ